jgi:trk system potassium uptake protein
MEVIIMGCGRVGEQLSRLLEDENHQVTVIDLDAHALERLGPDFKGRRVCGVGFDRSVLLQAGIETADAFAATSSSDNANIVAARIARNLFHVPRVVARLFDPRRAEIYQRLGLRTISSTTWGAERIHEMLVYSELDPLISFGNGEVQLVAVEIPAHWAGHSIRHLAVPGEITVITITRKGQAFLPLSGAEVLPGDIVHLALLNTAAERFQTLFGLGEGD